MSFRVVCGRGKALGSPSPLPQGKGKYTDKHYTLSAENASSFFLPEPSETSSAVQAAPCTRVAVDTRRKPGYTRPGRPSGPMADLSMASGFRVKRAAVRWC